MAAAKIINVAGCGDLAPSLYLFAKKGDKLAMHAHTDDGHVTQMAGRFIYREVRLDGSISEQVLTNSFLNPAPGVTHEFEAAEDGARLCNIPKRCAKG